MVTFFTNTIPVNDHELTVSLDSYGLFWLTFQFKAKCSKCLYHEEHEVRQIRPPTESQYDTFMRYMCGRMIKTNCSIDKDGVEEWKQSTDDRIPDSSNRDNFIETLISKARI